MKRSPKNSQEQLEILIQEAVQEGFFSDVGKAMRGASQVGILKQEFDVTFKSLAKISKLISDLGGNATPINATMDYLHNVFWSVQYGLTATGEKTNPNGIPVSNPPPAPTKFNQ